MAQVDSSIVAVTSINNEDGLRGHIQAQHGAKFSRVGTSYYPNTTRTTEPGEGTVTESGIAVPSVNNEDGILIDYYKQYNGNGSTDDGWPERDKWISFMDMCVLYICCFAECILLNHNQVQ